MGLTLSMEQELNVKYMVYCIWLAIWDKLHGNVIADCKLTFLYLNSYWKHSFQVSCHKV